MAKTKSGSEIKPRKKCEYCYGRQEMEMILGVITCDKCGQPMKVGQHIVVIGLSTVARENCELEVPEPEIRYACHLDCWDGVEVDY